jgi:APA family basic amino acid/polyamine antiporter
VSTALPRHLGLVAATSLLVGGVVGSGIFAVPADMLRAAPSVPVCLAIWLAAGAISFLGSLTFAELGSMLPEAGGEYVYLRESYGPFIAFLYGWVLLAVIQSGSISAVAVTFGEYATRLAGGTPAGWGIACVLVTGLVNLRTTTLAIGLQTLVTGTKVLALLAIGMLATMAAAPGSASHLTAALPGKSITLAGLGSAVMAALWAYDGWNAVSLVAGEVREPEKNLPRALVGGLSLVVLLYVLVFAAYVVTLTPAGVLASRDLAAEVADRVLGPWGARAMAALIALSTFGTVLGMMFTCPRTYYAMAQDRLFFAAAGAVHPRWGTPHVAVLVQTIWSVALVMMGSFYDLLNYVMFASWLFYGLTAAGLVVLRRRTGKPGPFPVPGYPWTPVAFCALSLLLMLSVLAENPTQAGRGVLMILAGGPLYWVVKQARSPKEA